MPRLAFKPDSSFFRKIAIGAIGSRAVCQDLLRYGHNAVELERGSTDTKLWKDVKRKRVRIPDLVCTNCGLRIESRAKTNAELSMSHSATEDSRAWDFGMVDGDCIAFPVCEATDENYWSAGQLLSEVSYWHERNWVRWRSKDHINYFRVSAFRAKTHARSTTKGVTEGSETAVAWDAVFSTRGGVVEAINDRKVTIRRTADGHRYTWTIRPGLQICVSPSQEVADNQLLASAVESLPHSAMSCARTMEADHIKHLLASRERTQRFTGVKLARLRKESEYKNLITQLASDQEEDVYIRLEAASYLASVSGISAGSLFDAYLKNADSQTQLESVIALGEANTAESIQILSGVLDNSASPYFLRSAAAWALSRTGSTEATSRLVHAFADVDKTIRDEALEGVVSMGGPALPMLLSGIQSSDGDIAAGCAESLRQQLYLPGNVVKELVHQLRVGKPKDWTVWLLGHLPRDQVATEISELQSSSPALHYAITVLWSFVESWIARRWEVRPRPEIGKT
jgi:HEAT repeat protein